MSTKMKHFKKFMTTKAAKKFNTDLTVRKKKSQTNTIHAQVCFRKSTMRMDWLFKMKETFVKLLIKKTAVMKQLKNLLKLLFLLDFGL